MATLNQAVQAMVDKLHAAMTGATPLSAEEQMLVAKALSSLQDNQTWEQALIAVAEEHLNTSTAALTTAKEQLDASTDNNEQVILAARDAVITARDTLRLLPPMTIPTTAQLWPNAPLHRAEMLANNDTHLGKNSRTFYLTDGGAAAMSLNLYDLRRGTRTLDVDVALNAVYAAVVGELVGAWPKNGDTLIVAAVPANDASVTNYSEGFRDLLLFEVAYDTLAVVLKWQVKLSNTELSFFLLNAALSSSYGANVAAQNTQGWYEPATDKFYLFLRGGYGIKVNYATGVAEYVRRLPLRSITPTDANLTCAYVTKDTRAYVVAIENLQYPSLNGFVLFDIIRGGVRGRIRIPVEHIRPDIFGGAAGSMYVSANPVYDLVEFTRSATGYQHAGPRWVTRTSFDAFIHAVADYMQLPAGGTFEAESIRSMELYDIARSKDVPLSATNRTKTGGYITITGWDGVATGYITLGGTPNPVMAGAWRVLQMYGVVGSLQMLLLRPTDVSETADPYTTHAYDYRYDARYSAVYARDNVTKVAAGASQVTNNRVMTIAFNPTTREVRFYFNGTRLGSDADPLILGGTYEPILAIWGMQPDVTMKFYGETTHSTQVDGGVTICAVNDINYAWFGMAE